MRIHIDVETYSSVDIKSCGVYKYVESPDFEILLISYAVKDGKIVTFEPHVDELATSVFLNYLKLDSILHAWNASFERLCINRYFGLELPPSKYRCTMVKASYCGLPMSLSACAQALALTEGKLDTGTALINFFCKPCRPTKANGKRTRNTKLHDIEKWVQFHSYVERDVQVERDIYYKLYHISFPESEQNIYELDQRINDEGVSVDTALLEGALKIETAYDTECLSRLKQITQLDNPNSATQLKRWLSEHLGYTVDSLNKDAVTTLIKSTDNPFVLEVLKLRQSISKTSTKKYTTVKNAITEDGTVKGLFQFYGARTGRWAGRLVQMQNLPRNSVDDIAQVREDFKAGDAEYINMMYEEGVKDLMSQLTRTLFVSSRRDKRLLVADFSAIEAVVTAWLAAEQWRLDVFKTHGKIYEASASMMFGVPLESISKKSELRQKGKIAELALGYGGGVGAMVAMGGEDKGLSEKDMQDIVSLWRSSNKAIVSLWRSIEKSAKRAVIYGIGSNVVLELPSVTLFFKMLECGTLAIELPSGRALHYYGAHIAESRFGGKCVKYKGMNSETRKWTNLSTYGGKLVENIVQAIARDLLVSAMENLAEFGFFMVGHIHDEVIAETRFNSHTLDKMIELMCSLPQWAESIPLKAEGFATNFYMKD